MSESWCDPLIREFPDRSVRVLLERPGFLVALVEILEPRLAGRLDPNSAVRLDPTFIDEEYRKRTSDLLYRCRFMTRDGNPLWVLCLLEHQSDQDPWMPVRFLHAMGRLWDDERRAGAPSITPVLPILFYTGEQPWIPSGLAELAGAPDDILPFLPAHRTLFVDLKNGDPAPLQQSDHPLAGVLLALREERSSGEAFVAALEGAARRISTMSEERIEDWRALVRYLFALVFQRRPPEERSGLLGTLRTRINIPGRQKKEMDEMAGTIAEELREEGRRAVLLALMEKKFGPLPTSVADTVRQTTDPARLDAWIAHILSAATLEELGLRD